MRVLDLLSVWVWSLQLGRDGVSGVPGHLLQD